MFELIYAINAKSFEDFIDAIGLPVTFVAMMFKWINFFYKIKSIKLSLKTLTSLLTFSADERWKSRDHVKVRVDFGYKIYKAFWFTAFITCSSGIFVPFVWFPFDTENTEFGFWIAALCQVFNSFVIGFIDVAVDILPVIFIAFATGLVDELADRLSEIGYSNEHLKTQDFENEFIKCIEIHKQIKFFINEIHVNFATVIFLQGLLSSIILCTCAFTMSTVSSLTIFKLDQFQLKIFLVLRNFELFPHFVVFGSDDT